LELFLELWGGNEQNGFEEEQFYHLNPRNRIVVSIQKIWALQPLFVSSPKSSKKIALMVCSQASRNDHFPQ